MNPLDNTDFEIELQEDAVTDSESLQLPVNFLSFGEVESDDVHVYIKQDVYKALEKLSSSDTSKELGSILIGEHCQEMGRTYVIISGYIEAKYTDASAATLTFTHETWDYVHREHEKRFPGQRIIGWQHTHPNYGIFLSNYDMFIQENFFNLPFQIAYVIDPIQNLRGFFQWKNGKVAKLRGYCIYDEPGKPVKVEQKKLPEKERSASAPRGRWVAPVITVLALAVAALALWCLSLNGRIAAQQTEQAQLYTLLQDQQAQLEAQSQQLDALQQVPSDSSQDTDGELRQQVAQLEDELSTCRSALTDLAALFGLKDPLSGEALFVEHTVAPGECLTQICRDPDQLEAGQVLRLPAG